MPLALQAALGFVQAIHYSAKAATVNRECCCGLSRIIGKIRPLLEEVEFESRDDATGMRELALGESRCSPCCWTHAYSFCSSVCLWLVGCIISANVLLSRLFLPMFYM